MTDKKDDSAVDAILLLLFIPISAFIQSVSISYIYSFYRALYGLPEITWHWVVGPLLIYGIVATRSGRKSDSTAAELVGRVVAQWLACLICVGLAYVFRP